MTERRTWQLCGSQQILFPHFCVKTKMENPRKLFPPPFLLLAVSSVKAGLNSFEAFEGFEKVVDGHSDIAGL